LSVKEKKTLENSGNLLKLLACHLENVIFLQKEAMIRVDLRITQAVILIHKVPYSFIFVFYPLCVVEVENSPND
jgi:hypothetical protein